MLIGAQECCFKLLRQNNTRGPQQNEMIRDRWVGRSWGWHKLIQRGLIHSVVTLSPDVSGLFHTLHLRWQSLSVTLSRTKEKERLPASSHCRGLAFPQWRVAVTAGSDKHEPGKNRHNRWVWNRAWRRAFMCKVRPLSCWVIIPSSSSWELALW